jgi:hypothetical protein
MIAAIHSRKATTEQGSVIRQALAIGALVLLLGCQESLPLAPSELTTGIVVYEHSNYLGDSAHITADIKHLRDFKGPCGEISSGPPSYTTSKAAIEWNDCISSIRLAPGWRATLYRDGDFDGDQLQVNEDMPDLKLASGDCDAGGFNDCTTSIRVFDRR